MKTYTVYILLCNDGLYYTGITNNVHRRLAEHQNGLDPNSFTYNKRPIQLVWQEKFNEVSQAILFEKRLKKWSVDKKKALIAGDF